MRDVLRQAQIQLIVFFRNRVAAFFTLILPLMFLVMINFFVSASDAISGAALTAAIAIFGVLSATFTNLAINTSMARDNGVLKRVAASPLPMGAHLLGRIVAAIVIALVSVALMLSVGAAMFGVRFELRHLPLFLTVAMIGAGSFSSLGLAIAAISPTARAAPAIANFVVLPLAFVSGVFFPIDASPDWIQTLARLLPLEPIATEAVAALTNGGADLGRALLSGLAWGGVGAFLATRYFSFEPTVGGLRKSVVTD